MPSSGSFVSSSPPQPGNLAAVTVDEEEEGEAAAAGAVAVAVDGVVVSWRDEVELVTAAVAEVSSSA